MILTLLAELLARETLWTPAGLIDAAAADGQETVPWGDPEAAEVAQLVQHLVGFRSAHSAPELAGLPA
jgi:hypothetical protein